VGPQGRSERVQKISTPIEIQTLDRPDRSESLYRLNYPGHLQHIYLLSVFTLYGRFALGNDNNFKVSLQFSRLKHSLQNTLQSRLCPGRV
jgi:hypothetical protein